MTLRLALALLALVLPLAAVAQVVSDPNQVRGSVSFTNTNPAVLAILDAPGNEGMSRGSLVAASLPPAPPSSHVTTPVVASRMRMDYTVTVEAGAAGTAYRVSGNATLSDSPYPSTYTLVAVQTAPVFPEPAPDVVADFAECAGIIRIHCVDGVGNPVTVQQLRARTTNPGAGDLRTVHSSSSPPGATGDVLVVRGDGATYDVTVTITAGTDFFSDRILHEATFLATVNCDEIVDVDVVVPTSAGGGLAAISGRFDILGEDEHRLRDTFSPDSRVQATDGPWNNERWAWIDADPSSGDFTLPNVVPSDAVVPAEPYELRGHASFGLGRRFSHLLTPCVQATPLGTATWDMGDAFVMAPARVSGTIFLAGPPARPGRQPPLARLDRASDRDADANGIPDARSDRSLSTSSSVIVEGVRDSSASCAAANSRGMTQGLFEGAYDTTADAFAGDHELVVAAPGMGDIEWLGLRARLRLISTLDPAAPEEYVILQLDVDEQAASNGSVPRGGRQEGLDLRYCLSDVQLPFTTTSGTLFLPTMTMTNGTFTGTDFEGRTHAYTVNVLGPAGTPATRATAAASGLLAMQLPQGTYTGRPAFQALSPGGTLSESTLAPVTFSVGCRQRIELHPDVQVALDVNLPPCSPGGDVVMQGRVTSVRDVDVVGVAVNGGPETVACAPCGISPTFSVPVTLAGGESVIRVRARDVLGNEAAASAITRAADEPSALDLRPGAEPLRVTRGIVDLTVTWEPGTGANAYAGTIASLHSGIYDHRDAGACLVDVARAVLPMPAGDAYFLVAGACGGGESSYGRDSFGRERPPASPRCP